MITFDAVSHWYAERPVLQDITADLGEHRIGIVGANGSGKSTLARLGVGLVRPTRGRVLVDGWDTATQLKQVRRVAGFVFQDPDLQIVMPTVAEDLAFSLRPARLPAAEVTARVDRWLEDFGLAEHRDHPAHLLSGGQKQMLALAAVLITEPAILICDEPTTLLDLRNQVAVLDRLAGLPQQVILVTHDLASLADFDRVLVLDQGRIVADDTPGPATAAYRRLQLGKAPR